MGYKSLAFIFPASYYYDSLKQVNKQMWEEKVFTSVKLGNSPKASGVFSSTATKIENESRSLLMTSCRTSRATGDKVVVYRGMRQNNQHNNAAFFLLWYREGGQL